MFILGSNFATAPETKPTAYPSATTKAEKSFRQQSPRFSSSASASTASKFLEKWEVLIGVRVTADIHNGSYVGHKMPKGSPIAAPPIADSGDAVPETAPEITPQMAPTPSSAKYGEGSKPSETGQSAGITVNVTAT